MWKDSFVYSFNYLPLAAGTANATATQVPFTDNIVRMHTDSDFIGMKICYTYTDPRIYFQIIDGSTGRYLTQVPGLDARTFMGSLVALGPGNNALIYRNLAQPIKAAASSPLNIRAADFSGASNTVRVALHGIKLRPGNPPWVNLKRNYKRDEYFTQPISLSISANATLPSVLATDVDADWFIYRILAVRTGNALITLSTGSGINWQDKAIHLDNFTGNIAGYNILPEPKFIEANSVLNVECTDISGATNTINLTLEGVKRYY